MTHVQDLRAAVAAADAVLETITPPEPSPLVPTSACACEAHPRNGGEHPGLPAHTCARDVVAHVKRRGISVPAPPGVRVPYAPIHDLDLCAPCARLYKQRGYRVRMGASVKGAI